MKALPRIGAFLCLLLLGGCARESVKTIVMPRFSDEVLRKGCTDLAAASDKELVDGWYYGQEARVFKSGYGRTKPEEKSAFAMDYHDLILQSGQNMTADWNSYLGYSKRAQFARTWWSNPAHDTEFARQDPKYKVVWIHEAVLDGGELWWRAYEKLAGDRVGAPLVLAHDAEQKLVFNYAEDEHHPGSFSTQERPP